MDAPPRGVSPGPSSPDASARENATAALGTLGPDDRNALLDVARQALARAAVGAPPPKLRAASARLLEPQACFVTLTKHGALRGCIGHVYPRAPLYLAVAENARWAALRDPRFRPVQSREVSDIHIEISVLSQVKPLDFTSPEDLLSQVHPHEHGVVLEIAGHSATFLPQVWTQLPEKLDFLEHLCLKSGCEPSAWRSPGTVISVFHAESFEEP
jgi:AmmeMemoRadiSam system protein A